ncbi:hypothetical protein P9112_000508 [Eukaryota sp. TZLM1-RC]
MTKAKHFGAVLPPLPCQVVVVSYEVEGKPSFTPIAFASCCNMAPPMITLSVNKAHLLNQTLKEQKFATLNVATTDMYCHVDRCGQVSGHKKDKSGFFEYTTHSYDGNTAYLVTASPLNIVCKLRSVVENPSNDTFILEVVDLVADESALGQNGKPCMSAEKVNPLIFSFDGPSYYNIGKQLPLSPWEAGKTVQE